MIGRVTDGTYRLYSRTKAPTTGRRRTVAGCNPPRSRRHAALVSVVMQLAVSCRRRLTAGG